MDYMKLVEYDGVKCVIVYSSKHSIQYQIKLIKERLRVTSGGNKDIMMKQYEPFMCKTYNNMNLIEIALRPHDCAFNNSRAAFREFLADNIDMSHCLGTKHPFIILYGASRTMILSCEHVLHHLLKHSTRDFKFIVCVGVENIPAHSTFSTCKKMLQGFCSILHFDKAYPHSSKSPDSNEDQHLIKLCNQLCNGIKRHCTESSTFSVMKEIDNFVMNSSYKMSSVLQKLIQIACSRNDFTEEELHSLLHKCCTIDSSLPNISNSKAMPTILTYLALYD